MPERGPLHAWLTEETERLLREAEGQARKHGDTELLREVTALAERAGLPLARV